MDADRIRVVSEEMLKEFAVGATDPRDRRQIERLIEQDPARASWRVWGAVWSAVAAVLAVPEVQVGLQAAIGTVVPVAWAPVVPAILGVIWPLVSKARDPRPVRSGR